MASKFRRYLFIFLGSAALTLAGCSQTTTPATEQGIDASDASDTTNTGDATDTSDTSDPSVADEPSDSEESTDASDPSDLSDLSEASDPADTTEPSETGEPSDTTSDLPISGQWTQTIEDTTLRLTLSEGGHLRVERFQTTTGSYPDRGWTVASNWQWDDNELILNDEPTRWFLETQDWILSVSKDSGLITLTAASGEVYRELDYTIDSPRLNVVLDDRDHFVALGEKTGGLDKRGEELTMWTTDAISPGEGIAPWSDPIYQSHPFVITVREGEAFGLYFQNTFRSVFDLGKNQDEVVISADGGGLDYVLIPGPSIPKIVERYTDMTGKTFMPPLWTMGYHQCKWSYHPDTQVQSIADTFRERDISADGMWLDIHYMDGYRSFTWSPTEFSQPQQLLSNLEAQGFKTTVIIDPGIKEDPGYGVYDTGMAGGHFVDLPNGDTYIGEVWPGPSVFPDYSSPDTRDWWADLVPAVTDFGVKGIWIDMNEPTTFTGEFPLDTQYDGEGIQTTHREVRNVYAKLMAVATMKGLREALPGQRPFVLTRAGFAGISPYSAVWTGDALSTWEHLAMTPAMLSNMGLSGIPFAGSDVGGFTGDASQELFTRWMAVGSVSPFFRGHVQEGKPGHEPWAYNSENLTRPLIDVRYELLPYLYELMETATRKGHPIVRPMIFKWPNAPQSWRYEDVWLLGDNIMVVPALQPGITNVSVEVPEGVWVDRHSGARILPEVPASIDAPLNRLPMLIRANAAIPTWPRLRWVGERAPDPLYLDIYPDLDATGVQTRLCLDDGLSEAFRDGDYLSRDLTTDISDGRLSLTLSEAEGSYEPQHSKVALRLHFVSAPETVRFEGEELTAAEEALVSEQGYVFDSATQLLTVWFARSASAQTIEVQLGAKPSEPAETHLEIDIVLPADTPLSSPIYVASNATEWNADGTLAERISPTLARATIAVDNADVLEFKITKGTWDTVQKFSDCSETPNELALSSANFSGMMRYRHVVWRFADNGCN